MKKKTKLILSSVATIAMSASLIAGGTYALFTDKANVNIAAQAGDVDVIATVVNDSLETYSIAWNDGLKAYESLPTAKTGKFTNGGTATITERGTKLELDLVSPGDSVKFTIDVENNSNLSVQYRVVMSAEGELAEALKATATIDGMKYAIDGIRQKCTLWQGAEAFAEIGDIDVEIELPDAEDNDLYKGTSATITYSVEAVQGNAHVVDHQVDTASKLQDAFTLGGSVEMPGVNVNPTQSLVVGRSDVTLGEANLTNKNLTAGSDDIAIVQHFKGSTFTLTSGANLTAGDIGGESYAILQYMYGDVVLEEGSKITASGENSSGIMMQNFGETPVRLYLEASNLIVAENGAKGISLAGGGAYEIYVNSYTDYAYYKGITEAPADDTAQSVTWYVNDVAVSEDKAVVTTGDDLDGALNVSVTQVAVTGDVALKGDLSNTAKKIAFVGTGAASCSIDLGNVAHTASDKSVAFEKLTLIKTNDNYNGFHHAAKETYTDCVIEGAYWTYAAEVVFNNCTFVQTSADAYNIWTYGSANVTFNNCTFDSAGKSVLIYNEGATGTNATFNDCTLNASAPVEGKAAIEIDSSLLKGDDRHIVTINNTTANGFDKGSVSNETLYNHKKGEQATIIVDGEEIVAYGLTKNVESGVYSINNSNGLAACGETYFALGGTFALTTDLDMTDVPYVVPNVANALTINGNGYAISDLTIVGGTYAGLLGYVSDSVTIDSLTIENSTISASNEVGESYSTGAFIAWAEIHETPKQVVIENCTVENVTLGSSKYVGGLVGYQSGLALTVRGCTVTGCTFNSNFYDEEYKGHVGGVVGMFYNGTVSDTTIKDCVFNVEGARGGVVIGSAQADAVIEESVVIDNVTFNGIEGYEKEVGAVDYRTTK